MSINGQDIFEGIVVEVIANLIIIGLLFIATLLIASYIIVSKRQKLINFLKLDKNSPSVTIYVPSIKISAKPPIIDTQRDETQPSRSLALEKIESIQQINADFTGVNNFESVPAMEFVQVLNLTNLIEQPAVFDWLPREIESTIGHLNPKYKRIKANIDVCPDNIERFAEGTIILMGGPRTNLGTFYFLHGEEAGFYRLRRESSEKHIVESMDGNVLMPISDPTTKNTVIVQRFSTHNRTIFYLIASGVNGIGVAASYFTLHWQELHKNTKRDFAVVLECDRRAENSDPSEYLNRSWNDDDWIIKHKVAI